VDLTLFKRIQPPANDRHLILEAPNAISRRALMDALKASRSHVRIHLHLSPQGKANKTLVYYQSARLNEINIGDRGDIMNVSWKQDPTKYVNLEILKSAQEVSDRLHSFFGTRPKN
jgi:hypothetical protein